MCKELGQLAQGHKNLTNGTNTLKFLTLDEIKMIPKNKTVTYARITVDYRPQKKRPIPRTINSRRQFDSI